MVPASYVTTGALWNSLEGDAALTVNLTPGGADEDGGGDGGGDEEDGEPGLVGK